VTESVIEVLFVAKNVFSRRLQDVCGELFRCRLSGASSDRDDRLVPNKVNSVCQSLKRGYRIVYQEDPVGNLFEFDMVLFKTVWTNDCGNRAFLKCRTNILCRVLKSPLKPLFA
jgi:hypothetical protein